MTRGDVLLALALVVASLAIVTIDPPARHPIGADGLVLIVSATAPIAVRNIYPRAVLLVVSTALILLSLTERPTGVPGVTALIALFTVARACSVWWAVGGAVLLSVLPAVAVLTYDVPARYLFLTDPLAIAAAGLLGHLAQQVGQRQIQLAEAHEQLATEAVRTERVRIARELHDVVAHGISVIALRAGVARASRGDAPPAIREALTVIEDTSREALIQMRHLLRVLRSDHEDDAAAPQPTIADLDPLLRRVAHAGVTARLVVAGTPRPLDAGLQLTVYRIVQEALTNVIKHAPAADATVTLDYRADHIALHVSDTGATTPPRRPSAHGQGLVGIRERVALHDGTLRTGPGRRGGFEVDVTLPYEELS